MSRELFWGLVAESGGDAHALKHLLLWFSREQLLAFDRRLGAELALLDRPDIHDVTDGSDDGFLYERLGIISRGRDYFESVLRDPENAPHFAHDDEENEEFMYAAPEMYEEQFGEMWPLSLLPRWATDAPGSHNLS
jgi:hypothetical protein